jgi:crotonobetainyl-CoA:carnitine CoA-transferase CaiB-like acyl-CoA transferase
MTSADATTPLHGLLVADFSRVLAGPLATMMLADLGATVIKVERPGVGDETRAWGPPYSEHGSTYFESVNRSKQSVTLDLTDAGDRALAVELALRADVVVTNFKPGTMERLGLGHDDLKDRNPGLIYCVVNGFGEAGGRDLLGYDFVVQAVGGLMSITGTAGEPTKVGVAVVDVLTGKDAVIGILAAVAARARTGRGDRIEVSLLTSALAALVNQGQAALETGRAPGALGNRHPSIAPYETLQCRDTLVAVACGNDGQFARLATVLGAPELSSRSEFAANAARVSHREQLVEQLEKLLADDLGLEPTVSVGDGHRPQVRHPVRWNTYRTATATPPPTLGEHAAAVRAWLTTADPHPHDRRLRGVSPRNLVEEPANPPIMGSGDPADPRSDPQPSTTEVT